MNRSLFLSILFLCLSFFTQAQNNDIVPADNPAVGKHLVLDTIVIYEIINDRDCIHSHLCCQVGCPCCPKGLSVYPALKPTQQKKQKARWKKKAKE